MENSKKKFDEELAPAIKNAPLPDSDLLPRRESKSVRTTITISPGTLDSMQWLKETQGIKPKEVLDAVLEREDLVEVILQAAEETKPVAMSQAIRKSIVLSSHTIRKLKEIAKKHSKPRDSLISMAVILMKVIIEKYNDERLDKHKQALDIIGKVADVEQELISLLGEDDPIVSRFSYVMIVLGDLQSAIYYELKDDIPIDPDDMSQSGLEVTQ